MIWWIVRSTGLVAQMALAATVVCGLGIAGGVPGMDRKRALELHESWTLAAIALTPIHALAVVLDAHAEVPVTALVLPFASPVASGAIALGTLALWGMGLVAASTVLRRRLGPRLWRVLHLVSYGTFVLGLAHGLLAGTDTGHPLALGAYALGAGAVVAASVFRAVGTSPSPLASRPPPPLP